MTKTETSQPKKIFFKDYSIETDGADVMSVYCVPCERRAEQDPFFIAEPALTAFEGDNTGFLLQQVVDAARAHHARFHAGGGS